MREFNEFSTDPEKPKGPVELESYSKLILSHKKTTRKMSALVNTSRRFSAGNDEKVSTLNKQRHEIHLELLELGKNLGKDENDVLVDLVRAEQTLDDYQLPEFSIMAENDILQTGVDHVPYVFNVEDEGKGVLLPASVRLDEIEKKKIKGRIAAHYTESVIPPGKFMLVFAIVPIAGKEEFLPDDYRVRRKRAEVVASNLNGKIINLVDTSYHAQMAGVLGVMFNNEDFNQVISRIRDNPEKFRLGKEFYDENELDEIERRKKIKQQYKKRASK